MSEKLLYVNVLGEYDWELRKKHAEKLTGKDLEIINQVADEDIESNKEALTLFMEKYDSKNPKEIMLKEALAREFAESQATTHTIKTESLRTCEHEPTWKAISAMLFHKDSQSMLDTFLGKEESPEAKQVKDTLEAVLLITGLPETQLQQKKRLNNK